MVQLPCSVNPRLAHTNPSWGCSQRQVFSFCPSLSSLPLSVPPVGRELVTFGWVWAVFAGCLAAPWSEHVYLAPVGVLAHRHVPAAASQPRWAASHMTNTNTPYQHFVFIIIPLVLRCNGLYRYVHLPAHPGRLLRPSSNRGY